MTVVRQGTLRDAIPNIKGEKTSRAQILKAATEYIRIMRSRNNDCQHDIDLLKRQNGDIDAQSESRRCHSRIAHQCHPLSFVSVRQLEKARAASHYARQSVELIAQQKHEANEHRST
jgi:hypothetical protein